MLFGSVEPTVFHKGQWLTRKQAIMEKAIPQQIGLMGEQGYPPTWELFSTSSGWKDTIESLELGESERKDYEERWKRILKDTLNKLGYSIRGGKLVKGV